MRSLSPSADRYVDAAHLLLGIPRFPVALLVKNGINGERGLARLAVANDELTLATTNRNHGVNGLDARLQRLVHGLAHHDAGSL